MTLSAFTVSAALQHAAWWGTLSAWGNIGSAVGGIIGGISAAVLAVAAFISGSAGLQDWRAKQQAQQAAALEEAESIRLERRRALNGWTSNGVAVYGVRLVTEPAEMSRACDELQARQGSGYVILRISEGGSDVNRAQALRQTIQHDGLIARAPGAGEYEALEKGRQLLAEMQPAGGSGREGRRSDFDSAGSAQTKPAG